jgi:hypothetical protein
VLGVRAIEARGGRGRFARPTEVRNDNVVELGAAPVQRYVTAVLPGKSTLIPSPRDTNQNYMIEY